MSDKQSTSFSQENFKAEISNIVNKDHRYIPCKCVEGQTNKIPLIEKWSTEAKTNTEIQEFNHPEFCMLAVRLDNILVLDADNVTFDEFDAAIKAEYGFTTKEVNKFRKSQYRSSSNRDLNKYYGFWLKLPPGVWLDRSKLKDLDLGGGRKIEVRHGSGCYQIVAGLHPTGSQYSNSGSLMGVGVLPQKMIEKYVFHIDLERFDPVKGVKKGRPKKVLSDEQFELEKLIMLNYIQHAPSVENRNEWRDLTFALRTEARNITPDGCDDWLFTPWVEWSGKAENSCSSYQEYEKAWLEFEPNGLKTGATYNKFFIKKEFDISLWGSENEKTTKSLLDVLNGEFKDASKLNRYVPTATKRNMDTSNLVYVYENRDRPYYDLKRKRSYAEKDIASSFNLSVKAFKRLIYDHMPKVYGLRYAPDKNVAFLEDDSLYLNTFESRRDYSGRPTTRLTAMYFKIVFSLLRLEDFVQFMNDHSHLIKFPGDKINHCMVLFSERQGIGKSTLPNPIGKFFGEDFKPTSIANMLGQYTDFLDGVEYIVVNDPATTSKKQKISFAAKFKDLIAPSNEKMEIIKRYEHNYYVKNMFYMFFTCNNVDSLYIEKGDRRYYCVEAKNEGLPLGDAYFADFYRLFDVIEPEEYEVENIFGVQQKTDNQCNGVKDIVGVFQRWDDQDSYGSMERLLASLEGFGVENAEFDAVSPESKVFEPYSPKKAPEKTSMFYAAVEQSFGPVAQIIYQEFDNKPFVFDEQVIAAAEENVLSNTPRLDITAKDRSARKKLMSEMGYKSYNFKKKKSGTTYHVIYYSKLNCYVGAKEKDEKRKLNAQENIAHAKKAYDEYISRLGGNI